VPPLNTAVGQLDNTTIASENDNNILWRNNVASKHNHCCLWKAVIVTYERVCVALIIPRAKCMSCIILPSVACLAVLYLSTQFLKQRFSGGGIIRHEMLLLIFSTTFVWNISLSTKHWARYCHKCALVFIYITRDSCQILMKNDFPEGFLEKLSNTKSHENPSKWESRCSVWTDTHHKDNSRFSKFWERA